jgi:hypothetical protein
VWPYTQAQELKHTNSLILLHHLTAMAYLFRSTQSGQDGVGFLSGVVKTEGVRKRDRVDYKTKSLYNKDKEKFHITNSKKSAQFIPF